MATKYVFVVVCLLPFFVVVVWWWGVGVIQHECPRQIIPKATKLVL